VLDLTPVEVRHYRGCAKARFTTA